MQKLRERKDCEREKSIDTHEMRLLRELAENGITAGEIDNGKVRVKRERETKRGRMIKRLER